MNKMELGELMSAMADGHFEDDGIGPALDALEADPQLQFTWDAYHLIGDVLRSPDLAATASSAVLLARLRPALAQEPLPAAPPAAPPEASVLRRARSPAANDGNFRWKLVAGLASLAAVAAVGWTAAGLGSPEQAQLAAAPGQPAVVQAAGDRNVMLRDARLDELLAAHRQFGSATAIQMPSGAVRNAGFEAPAR